MSRASLIRDAGRPQTAQDIEAIRQELQEVLASPHFCNSKRYPALLQYIVENTLAGKSELLKERTIGVEVFDRPPSYDTNADTVVRYTAGEVRKRLSLYYHELGRKPAIQISLPAGSYVPEFLHPHEDAEEEARHGHEMASLSLDAALHGTTSHGTVVHGHEPDVTAHTEAGHARSNRKWWLVAAAAVVVAVLAGVGWRYRSVPARTPMDAFWAPLLRDQHTVLVCSGGVVFKPENFSGVVTAGKDIDYPFVSSQIASSIARVSGLVARSGGTMNLQFSATTPLTTLREQPVVLLGGYNNLWTLRLLDGLPMHFSPEVNASIVDTVKNERWARDRSEPYSSADDYALIARFRDETTDSWVLVLAGLGRNGTEAATQFVTTPHYMQMLRDTVNSDLSTHNIEVVLKTSVIEGKTGAPSIQAVKSW
jgi:hypothetical protein